MSPLRGGISVCVVLASLLICPSLFHAFLLPPRGGLRLTRRLMVDIVKTPTLIAAPTVPHSVVSGSIGLFCSRCGETKDLMTTCVPAAAE